MSNGHTSARAQAHAPSSSSVPFSSRFRVTTRGIQIALGVVWLLDGLFQFKSFMYTHAIVSEVFAPAAKGQPGFIGDPMKTFANFYGRDLTLWNTLSGEIQVAIGLGLILSRKTVKPALLASFGWALIVWWFGEGFGGLTSTTLPSPLMGAPGAVILYAIIGLLVYPTSKEEGCSPADTGPLGDRGGLYAWSGLWLLSAGLWLVNVNRASGATHEMIKGMAQASPHWLAKFQNSIGGHTQGHGTTIAVVLAIVSVAVAVGVWTRLRWPALAVGIVLSLAYWVLGQDMGGPFWAEGATDFNSGPLFVLLALALLPRRRVSEGATGRSPAQAIPPPGPPAGLRSTMQMALSKANQDAFNKGEIRMQSSRKTTRLASGQRWAALGVLLAVMALAVSGCGGSSSEKTAATVTFKPMAAWDASHMAKTQTSSMKGMSASEMKNMQSSAKAAEGLPFVATTASGEGHFEQVGDHLTGWRRITGLVPYSRHANHLHGPDGACSPESKQTSNMAVVLPDLVANDKGEAYGTVNLIVHQRVIGPGYFMVVHAKPTPASQQNQIGSAPASMAFMQAMSNDPAILCGNITVKS